MRTALVDRVSGHEGRAVAAGAGSRRRPRCIGGGVDDRVAALGRAAGSRRAESIGVRRDVGDAVVGRGVGLGSAFAGGDGTGRAAAGARGVSRRGAVVGVGLGLGQAAVAVGLGCRGAEGPRGCGSVALARVDAAGVGNRRAAVGDRAGVGIRAGAVRVRVGGYVAAVGGDARSRRRAEEDALGITVGVRGDRARFEGFEPSALQTAPAAPPVVAFAAEMASPPPVPIVEATAVPDAPVVASDWAVEPRSRRPSRWPRSGRHHR